MSNTLKHMNAVALKGKKYHEIIDNPDYIIEEKLKGIRAFLIFGKDRNTLISRGGHDMSHRFPHIQNYSCPDFFGTTLDGELYQEGVADEVIAGWGNHRTKHINADVTHNVKFYAFDIVLNGIIQIHRKSVLESSFYHIPFGKPIELVPWIDAEQSNAEVEFQHYLSQGGEGIMLKNKYALYEPGARHHANWYKLKGEETFDVIITGFEMAERMSIKKGDTKPTPTKFAGMIGAFTYGMYVSYGRYKRPENFSTQAQLMTLGSCSGMDDNTRMDMTLWPNQWLNQVVEIKGVEQNASGAIDNPRYIRLRPDKNPEECIWIRE